MTFLFRFIRFFVLLVSCIIAIGVYLFITMTIPDSSLQTIRLTEIYGFISIIYLYITLLISPLYDVLPFLPFRALAVRSRRALGVSAFFFGLLHGFLGFFFLLGGFAGLRFLDAKYLFGISLSFVALLILSVLAATSFDFMIKKLGGPRWTFIHRFVYLAAFLLVFHVLLLGSHFVDLSAVIPQVFFAALFLLLILESIRFDRYMFKKFSTFPRLGIAFVVVVWGMFLGIVLVFLPQNATQSLNIHAQHQQLARQALRDANQKTGSIPSLVGDRTKRYSVGFSYPDDIQPGQDVDLKFTIYDASSGNPVLLYKPVYEKVMHMIIVNSDLTYFSHIHPTQQGNSFVVTTQFSADGMYHIYINFQPFGAIEQQFGFTLPVGDVTTIVQASQKPDTNLKKTFGDYTVALDLPAGGLDAQEMTIGNQKLTFVITDAKTKKPVTTLQPYLGAFGHLVLINESTYDYLHVHPASLTIPSATDHSGPTVEFLPIGIYGQFKPGIYRLFAQFNPDGKLFTSDFTVKVK